MPEPNAVLLDRARDGDAAALNELAGMAAQPVYQLCLSITRNTATAEDAAQEILLKVITSLSSFKGDSAFSTWVYRIAHNHCLDLLRGQSRRRQIQLSSSDEGEEDDQSLEEMARDTTSFLRLDETIAVQDTLDALDPKDRMVLTLRDLSGLSYDEIAQACAISEQAVKSRLFRARNRFRELYEKTPRK